MYTLRGADQQEHGPLSTRDVRDWISTGRAGGETLARADGEESWRPLSQFEEFKPTLEIVAAANQPPALPVKRPNRIMALIALVLSVLPLTVIPAVVLAGIALVLTKKKPQQFGGKRLAAAALIVCAIWVIGIPTTIYFGRPILMRKMMRRDDCFTHARSLTTSLQIVSIANNGVFPSADSWCDAIKHEVTSKTHYQCPNDPKHGECAFAYNEKLSGVKDPNPQTVMIFESDLGWNGAGGISNVVATPRHRGFIVVGFANGNLRGVTPQQLKTLRWEP